jgi:single-strand DNA-binding protein
MFNEATLIGRIGQSSIAATSSGMQILNASLATSKSIKDKQSGEFSDHTEWHSLVFFGQIAENLFQKLQAGDMYLVKGELRTRDWEKDGVKHYKTEIVVNDYPKKLPRYFKQQSGVDNPQPNQQQAQPAQQPTHQQPVRQPQQSAAQPPRQQQYRQQSNNEMDMPDF